MTSRVKLVFTDIIERKRAVDCDYELCGAACCKGYIDESIWNLSGSEIERIRQRLQERTEEFISGSRIRIKEGACPFLDPVTDKCNIYDSRPLICRTFPFHLEPNPLSFFDSYHAAMFEADLAQRKEEVTKLALHLQERYPAFFRDKHYYVYLCPDCPRVMEGVEVNSVIDPSVLTIWVPLALECTLKEEVIVLRIERLTENIFDVLYENK